MARGADKGSKHFEDTRMNPTTGKGKHAEEPKGSAGRIEGDAIARNVTGKTGTPHEREKK